MALRKIDRRRADPSWAGSKRLVEKAKKEIEEPIKEEGDKAAFDLGVHEMHPELVRLLGRLKYRTSFGQNGLIHTKEVARLLRLMAIQLGWIPRSRCGLDCCTISARVRDPGCRGGHPCHGWCQPGPEIRRERGRGQRHCLASR